ncbi:MAG TPA: ATP-binding protein [Longimicrobium sp.]|nr:ATP-binding protein [Longimicrobium sp.]
MATARMNDGDWFRDRRVLTVDDSRAVRLYLRDILTRYGARVAEAPNGVEALAQLGEPGAFDLVLLDLNLPDLDGIQVLEKVRETDDVVPVVMITGAGGIQSATEAVRRGADGYIEKQHLSGDEDAPFLYALEQAVEHRAGFVAQRQLQETKADFYSMVTHDLRNPAGNVWGIVKLLLAGKAGPLTPKQEQLLGIASTSAGKLVGLINDYLDFATIDAGYLRVDRREADLRALVEEAARQAGPQAGVKQQTIFLDLPRAPVPAFVDAERLAQVLDNLVSNALKYTPDGGWITLALRLDGADAVLMVRDTGLGVDAAQLPRLFNKYHRVPGEERRGIRGTGLGLLIVKEIAEAHGGTVRAESPGEGKGTTFTVTIPLRPAEEEPASPF